jgi:hypothetical protein
MFFLALHPTRPELYLTSILESARLLTRQLLAVPLDGHPVRSLGVFSTAGEGLRQVRFSADGSRLGFLAGWGPRVTQGLYLVQREDSRITCWPTEGAVRSFRQEHPDWSLEVVDYAWTGATRFVARLRCRPGPGEDAPAGPAPSWQGWLREQTVDARSGKLLRESWQPDRGRPEPLTSGAAGSPPRTATPLPRRPRCAG